MRLVARKKIVFVIVEGPSDEEALDAVMSKLLILKKCMFILCMEMLQL